MANKSKAWPVVGQIVENKDKNGKPFRTVKFADNVTILVDGKEISLNQYRSGNLVCPVEEVENLIEKGIITEDKVEFRRQKAEEVKSWLKYNIVVPPGK